MSSTQRSHLMPFGVRLLNDGRVNFRLWAPGAQKVELCLQGLAPEACFMMASEDNGWYGIITEFADVGCYYQYRINEQLYIPDLASRFQPDDIYGSSQVIDPNHFQWSDSHWRGLHWPDAIFYELHVGTFSTEGTFAGVKNKLDYLVELGITAIQLMPIAEFPGRCNWGYDGVLPFAPDSQYGTPDELKDLINSAHAKGIMVFNDVIYNHFGPEGNYLGQYAADFFTDQVQTPWGSALNFSGKNSYWVRQFFMHNALYWLEEYHFDGLRLDAVHAIFDASEPDIIRSIAEAARQRLGYDREIHLVLENDHNAAHYLRSDAQHPQRYFNAQWNDDFHHAMHVLLTTEETGYYQDYSGQALQFLGRCLTEGFAYQGEVSAYREGQPRGEPCEDLPLTAFVNFIQNHDQVGNRANGERLSTLCTHEALRAATAILLLSPSPPLLFMGQEWACSQPFTYFVDFPDYLAEQVNQGRLQAFTQFADDADSEVTHNIPVPNATRTFELAKLAWDELHKTQHAQWLAYHQELLYIRRCCIRPIINTLPASQAIYSVSNQQILNVHWTMSDGSVLKLLANLSHDTANINYACHGELLFSSEPETQQNLEQEGRINPWNVIFLLEPANANVD